MKAVEGQVKNSFKSTLKHFKALVLMQLRDKLDFSFLKSKKKTITKTVFFVLRLLIVAAVSYYIFYYSATLSLFSIGGTVPVGVVSIIYAIIFVLSLLSCTVGLMKTLYFADDNKVLVTMPVTGNMVFFSKLVIYYIFELIRSLTFTLPLFIGYCMISGHAWYMYLWLLFVLIFVSALPVALGALLSLPAMIVYQFLKKHGFVKAVCFLLIIAAFIAVIVRLILLIPENLNLVRQWPWISQGIQNFITEFNKYAYPILQLTIMMLGVYINLRFIFTVEMFIIFIILLAVIISVLAIVYFIAKPLFLKMTAQPFEFEKNEHIKARENKRRYKYSSIMRKEFILNVRSTEISYSFLSVYIAVPILILLLNKIFAAMNTKLSGQYMTYSFNLLIMLLILLASNAIISGMYSMEGRAGYMKKTKPLDMTLPLLIKLTFNLIFSVLSIGASIAIFASFSTISAGGAIMLGFCLLFFQVGHMLWSAERDIMNPQNEQYATTGGEIDNPNSNATTISAFIISVAVALFSYKLFSENALLACLKLMLLGLAFAVMRVYMFIIKVRVYYKEKM